MKIIKKTDRILVEAKGVKILISPIQLQQRIDIGNSIKFENGESNFNLLSHYKQLFKYSVKEVTGVEDSEGKPYELSFDGEVLTDDCAEELTRLFVNEELSLPASEASKGKTAPQAGVVFTILGK